MIINKDKLVENINNDLADNSSGDISPRDIRHNLLDIIDSVHLLTEFHELNSQNFGTENTRSTRVGLESISKIDLEDHYSVDNTAVGFASLKSNYQGQKNTALGSFSLTCNIWGEDNVGIGFHSLGSNTTGIGNVGAGSFSLEGNKTGNFNIAIGHGAGFYVDKETNKRLFIASHEVDETYVCSNPDGEGLIPLIHGDLDQSNHRLGIGIRELHEGATLQVGGNIHPANNKSENLGSEIYRFNKLYLNDQINFDSCNITHYKESNRTNINSTYVVDYKLYAGEDIHTSGNLIVENNSTVSGDFLLTGDTITSGHIWPTNTNSQNFGRPNKIWKNIYCKDLRVDGFGRFNRIESVEKAHFLKKTLYLASSGEMSIIDGGAADGLYSRFSPNEVVEQPAAIYLDEDLNGAGIVTQSSGIDYSREYRLVFKSTDSGFNTDSLSEDNVYSRTSWDSNISLSVASGCHISADRIIGTYGSVGLFENQSSIGILIDKNKTTFGNEKTLNNINHGLGNLNFLAGHDEDDSHVILFGSRLSSVNILHRFAHNLQTASNSFSDDPIFNGFEAGFISDSTLPHPYFFNERINDNNRRFVINSYDNTEYAKRSFCIMQNAYDGIVGISNFDYCESMIPDTALNIRCTGNAVFRITAENQYDTESSIELLAKENCLKNGFKIQYINSSGVSCFRNYTDSKSYLPISIDGSGNVGILNNNFSSRDMFSVGCSDNTQASIAIHHRSGVPLSTAGYGKIFTNEVDLDGRSSNLSFIDSSGNLFDIQLKAFSGGNDLFTEKYLLTDDYRGNTFGGSKSPLLRANITSSTNRNTAIGRESLSILNNGSDNTCFGYKSGFNTEQGSNNIIVGSNNYLPEGQSHNNNFIISNNENLTSSSYNYVVGPLINGTSQPNNESINIMSEVSVYGGSSLDNSLSFGSNFIKYTDVCTLRGSSNVIATFDNTKVKYFKDVLIDQGASLVFGDSTLLSSASFLLDISANQSNIEANQNAIETINTNANNLSSRIDNFSVEGVVLDDIRPSDWPNTLSDSEKFTFRIKRYIKENNIWGPDNMSHDGSDIINVVLRDPYTQVFKGDYIIAIKVGDEYRMIYVSGPPQ